ncbi:CPBP family intramembrane metalloprotease [Brevibacillus fluminis]|uniref:CPBP family intramembrane metalloprotease n=1 Tax=Brevibacillus fluminis TaxID=511487 RepID=A0A3M8DBQ1_9BACL|nr:CPBP family intramembrane glutamic endopeptidase [Brevibacillus fluminis]RNB85049.1 CPBP family intramembrane metalloprotease [Brevibacillus fluminis]
MSIVTIVLWATPYTSVRIQEEVTGAALWLLPLKILFLLVYYTITSALGEELGWRGYLLPKFADLGWGKAFLLSGTVHALFHFPLIFTGRYHSEGNPWIVIPMFVFSLLLIGVIFRYIRMTTQSVWPAAIMHAMHNIAMAFYREFTEVTSPAMSEYIGSESGIAAIILYGAIAVWFMTKMKRNNDAEQLMRA